MSDNKEADNLILLLIPQRKLSFLFLVLKKKRGKRGMNDINLKQKKSYAKKVSLTEKQALEQRILFVSLSVSRNLTKGMKKVTDLNSKRITPTLFSYIQ
jgi:hypothetical protein